MDHDLQSTREAGAKPALPMRAWTGSVLLLALAVAGYFQTWADLWPYWENKNATYTHGTLIAAVTLWLIWRLRRALSSLSIEPTLAALPIVFALSAVWLLAAHANIFVAHAMLWPVLAFSILWAGVGRRVARQFVFPLGFLYFAIPFWDYLKPPLQVISSTMVGLITGLAGVQAFVEGPHVVLPHTTIFIAQECSGAHFLSVALAVGALAGELRGDGLRTRLLIMGIAAALSMIFNWLRIVLIVLAYLHPDLQRLLETMGHYTFGWWVFALDLVVFYLALRLVPSNPPPSPAPAPARAAEATPAKSRYWLASIASILLPAAAWACAQTDRYPDVLLEPPRVPHATGPLSPDLWWRPRFKGAAWEHRAAYMTSGGQIVELYRNEYHEQAQGAELVSDGFPLFDPDVFTTMDEAPLQLQRPDGAPLPVARLHLVDRSQREWIALVTYSIDDSNVASPRAAQMLTAIRSLYGRPAAGVLAIAGQCVPDCAAAAAGLGTMMVDADHAYTQMRSE